MSDIVERLRVKDDIYTPAWAQTLMDEAADEIERLRAELRNRHDATTCRHISTTQAENVRRLDAECNALTERLDAERALADHLASGISGHHPAYAAWLNARRNP